MQLERRVALMAATTEFSFGAIVVVHLIMPFLRRTAMPPSPVLRIRGLRLFAATGLKIDPGASRTSELLVINQFKSLNGLDATPRCR